MLPEKIIIAVVLMVSGTGLLAQPSRFGSSIGEGPWRYTTASPAVDIEVSVVVHGIDQPFGMVFVPQEGILVVEQDGNIRIIRDEVLLPEPVSGVPAVSRVGGLMDIVLHPDFATNRYLYFTYMKDGELPEGENLWSTIALGRGRLSADLTALTEVEDLFVAEAWSSTPGGTGSRLVFAEDGSLFMSSPFRRDFTNPQNPMSHISKLLRLDDEGKPAEGNPFENDADYLPEIWTIGHRAIEGMMIHPYTGELWASEHGPQGGDEINIIHKGGNYGWPLVSYGRDYSGTRQGVMILDDMIAPEIFWVPSIATSGLMVYTGEAFPQWQGNIFAGSMMTGRVPGTGHIERIEINDNGEQAREWLLADLRQRVRDVRQGPDGLIYVLTDESDGALLRISPAK